MTTHNQLSRGVSNGYPQYIILWRNDEGLNQSSYFLAYLFKIYKNGYLIPCYRIFCTSRAFLICTSREFSICTSRKILICTSREFSICTSPEFSICTSLSLLNNERFLKYAREIPNCINRCYGAFMLDNLSCRQ